jgi:hypothetical protein
MKKLMFVVCLLIGILLGATGGYAYFILTEIRPIIIWPTYRREDAYNYLVNSYNSTLGLCHVYPGSNTYYVTHDNVLASYALQNWNRTIADNISETVKRLAKDYNLTTSSIGIPLDTRAEILLGYIVNSFNETEDIILNASYYGSVLKTEKANDSIIPESVLENYTDLLCYASLNEWRKQNLSGADYYYEKANAMWDGKGFNDTATKFYGYYATYKLGLFYLTSKTLGKKFDFEKDIIEEFSLCQLINGGFVTDYYGDGSYPSGAKTNTETTSIMLLADIPLIFIYY